MTEAAADGQRPRHLIVLGAGRGMGRWLSEQLFALVDWDSVVVADIDPSIATHPPQVGPHTTVGIVPAGLDGPMRTPDGVPLSLAGPSTVVCVSTPQADVLAAARWIADHVDAGTQLFDTSSSKTAIQLSISLACPNLYVFGAHPLFGPQIPTIDGQTVAVIPSRSDPNLHTWLVAMVEAVGGVALVESAADHDRYMSYVQTLAHQTLLSFVDVLGASGEDLDALWENRTPLFEALLGLAARALSPGQERTIASIQKTTEGARVLEELRLAIDRLHDDIAEPPDRLRAAIVDRREPFSASLFDQVQLAANAMVAAAQATRTEAAAHLRSGAIVGLAVGGETIHVGRVRHVDTNHIVFENILVGRAPNAALSSPELDANVRRLGVGGRPRSVTVSVGRARFLTHDRLERFLDETLGRVHGDVRLLVPETVSGDAVCAALVEHSGVDSATLRAETIRLGQREVVARVGVRADRVLDADELRRFVDAIYRPAHGIVDVAALAVGPVGSVGSGDGRAAEPAVPALRVAYLGPDGTFSHLAAERVATLADRRVDAVAADEVVEVLRRVADGEVDAGVVPVSNSSSGVVDAALVAVLATTSGRPLRGCGVVDVGIRFAAYGWPGDGTPCVVSHPQALRQCAGFVRRLGATTREVSSTAVACDEVAATRSGIALARSGLGETFHLPLVADDVSDLGGAITRFMVVVPADRPMGPTGPTHRHVAVVGDVGNLLTDWRDAYAEVLAGADGRALVVASTPVRGDAVVDLGIMPWSPRTPIVAVAAVPPEMEPVR